MPAKKDAAAGALLTGFEDRETKLIAAAYLSTIGPDKFDYDLMASLTGNTTGSLKKMWPPVKRKAMEKHESFGKWLGQGGTTAAATFPAAPKTAAAKKRKAADEDEAAEEPANGDTTEPMTATDQSDGKKPDSKSEKKAPPKQKKAPSAKKQPGHPRKQVKKEEAHDELMADPDNNPADGGDGVGA